MAPVINFVKTIMGPKYDGKYLQKLLKEDLKETKLHQTLTNVVIPAFDIACLQPVIFSSYKVCVIFQWIDFTYIQIWRELNPRFPFEN